MGGVNSNRPPDPAKIAFESDIHNSRSKFRATGQGLMVTKPDNARVQVNYLNANATLTTITAPGETAEAVVTQHLFVDRLKTSYQLSGTTGQSQEARTFYPRHLTQSDLIISGTMPNQYEFDKLVVFVNDHQKQIVTQTDVPFDGEVVQVKGITFTYHTPGNSQDTYDHGPRLWGVQYKIAIINIMAGHERFKFAPAYTLTCKILDDQHYGLSKGEEEIVKSLELDFDYAQVFGLYGHPLGNPSPKEEANFALELNTQTKKSPGTGGGGGGSYAPGRPDKYADKIAAGAPGLSNPEKGNPIKAEMEAKHGPATPPGPGKQYFGQWADEGRVFPDKEAYCEGRAGGNHSGPHVHVKFRNPPSEGGNTIGVSI